MHTIITSNTVFKTTNLVSFSGGETCFGSQKLWEATERSLDVSRKVSRDIKKPSRDIKKLSRNIKKLSCDNARRSFNISEALLRYQEALSRQRKGISFVLKQNNL